jgi:hypothetical protein
LSETQIGAIAQTNNSSTPSTAIVLDDYMPSVPAIKHSPSVMGTILNPTGISVVLSNNSIPANSFETLTVSGTPNFNDAISLQATYKYLSNVTVNSALEVKQNYGDAATYVCPSSGAQTAAQVATGLAAAINARAPLNAWLSATASGAIVTITNNSNVNIPIQSFCGNVLGQIHQVGIDMTATKIEIWAPSALVRDQISDLVQEWIAATSVTCGFNLPSGEIIMLKRGGSVNVNADNKSNIYRRVFIVNLYYPVTFQDNAYSILAALPSNTFQ